MYRNICVRHIACHIFCGCIIKQMVKIFLSRGHSFYPVLMKHAQNVCPY